ncbi:aldo/keto reductase [Glomus cerebriforme]|uniref:Aldo/keto reductase n=1 Tax=Glomus cerebriforme TaxID=658196 RepID=A0A397SIP8_9GLOM|nr:aldo/keto reductase [Glomus cerebriforme]RIA86501.1 aldo/keto reductase [Glomus cerebriforme]
MSQDTSSPTKTTKALDDYVLLGRSGLRVSPLCLGALTFGESWGIGADKDESKKVFDLYYEKGGNFFDTACVYNFGESERFLGDYVSDKRSDVVIATKYTSNASALRSEERYNQKPGNKSAIRYNPNGGGNHRKSLVENLDESLKRLNMSYVDIFYVHAYEYRTPIEEFMRSLDDVLYVAASDIPSWAFSRANTIAELRGWSPFIGLQTRYNLLDRSLEFDLQPACAELDVGIIPWGIIAEGFLTGKYTRESSTGLKVGMRNNSVTKLSKVEKNWKILDEVKAIAEEIGRTPVQVALNWTQQKPGITSPLIGARTVAQLEENLKSLEFKLTPEQMKRLDEVSKPTEIPFPYSFFNILDKNFGKNIEVPNKFESIVNAYNYGTLRKK